MASSPAPREFSHERERRAHAATPRLKRCLEAPAYGVYEAWSAKIAAVTEDAVARGAAKEAAFGAAAATEKRRRDGKKGKPAAPYSFVPAADRARVLAALRLPGPDYRMPWRERCATACALLARVRGGLYATPSRRFGRRGGSRRRRGGWIFRGRPDARSGRGSTAIERGRALAGRRGPAVFAGRGRRRGATTLIFRGRSPPTISRGRDGAGPKAGSVERACS